MIRLLRTNASRYQSLDAGQLKARFNRLQTLLSNASPATKSVFAEPALVQGSENIDWLARLGGQPQPLSKVSQAEAAAVRGKLNGALNDVLRIADERAGASSDDAAFLRSVATYPSDDDVFVLNGQPVIAAWGYGLAGEKPVGPTPSSTIGGASAVALASGAAQATDDGANTTQASGVSWGRRLLLLFLLIMALSLFAWWYFRDFNWPPWFDYAAFHEAVALSEQELTARADALENDIEALREKCAPPLDKALLKGEEDSLRPRVSKLQGEIVDQEGLYDQHQIPHSQELRALQERTPPFNERITSLLRECDAIAVEFKRAQSEEIRQQQEQERLRLEEEEKRKEDEFDKRRAEAGGKQGELTVTLLWNTVDDLDLHIYCPDSSHIYYERKSGCGGTLDVDKNARHRWTGTPSGSVTREPIENVFWGSAQSGRYRIKVNLYKEGTRSRGARPFKIKVQKGEDVQYFEGKVSSGKRDVSLDFTYP